MAMDAWEDDQQYLLESLLIPNLFLSLLCCIWIKISITMFLEKKKDFG